MTMATKGKTLIEVFVEEERREIGAAFLFHARTQLVAIAGFPDANKSTLVDWWLHGRTLDLIVATVDVYPYLAKDQRRDALRLLKDVAVHAWGDGADAEMLVIRGVLRDALANARTNGGSSLRGRARRPARSAQAPARDAPPPTARPTRRRTAARR